MLSNFVGPLWLNRVRLLDRNGQTWVYWRCGLPRCCWSYTIQLWSIICHLRLLEATFEFVCGGVEWYAKSFFVKANCILSWVGVSKPGIECFLFFKFCSHTNLKVLLLCLIFLWGSSFTFVWSKWLRRCINFLLRKFLQKQPKLEWLQNIIQKYSHTAWWSFLMSDCPDYLTRGFTISD